MSRGDDPLTATRTAGAPLVAEPPPTLELPERYQDLGALGSGGMGEVRRVWDRGLSRPLAMKILRLDASKNSDASERFRAEATMTAGLQHPGIIVVHDQGLLPDGRPWLTMREVRGRTFAELYRQGPEPGETSRVLLRRRVDQLARACEAVAYAHGRGVAHRDLKPRNLMVGEHGEVLVLDWGIAERVDPADPPPISNEPIRGSPGYLPPERLRGEPASAIAGDVYAMGVVLHELLTGARPPRASEVSGPGIAELAARAHRPPPPEELCALCAKAVAPDPARRLDGLGALAGGLRDWLDGVRNLEQAELLLQHAERLGPTIATHRAEAEVVGRQAAALLASVPPHAPEADKRPAWALEDEAGRAEQLALHAELERERVLCSALELVPDLDAAHARLALHYRAACERARALRREDEAARLERLVQVHDRGEHAAWLRGEATLSLQTEPPGAEVRVLRYERDGRRLVATPVGPPLHTPLHTPLRTPLLDQVLPHGSYRLDLRAPGRATISLPVLLRRGERWDGCPPERSSPPAVVLPPAEALGPDERLIPAGWFLAGGDPDAPDSLPATRLWLDSFVMQRDPVTNRAYLAFLDDLVDCGREAEALALAPRDQGQREGDPCLLDRDADGHFVLRADAEGALWRPDWPVTMIPWHAALAYAAWWSARTGQRWRLPHDLEWAKAARGVDGRPYPWGDHADPSWARMVDSLPDRTERADVDATPLDLSPYGVRGMGGNVRDWCANLYQRMGPAVVAGRPVLEAARPEQPGYRVVRGGCWASAARMCRSASRFASMPEGRLSVLGFRLVRDL